MNETSLMFTTHLQRRMGKKIEALRAYDTPFPDVSQEVIRMREIEAIKLRHEISVLNDLIDVVTDMFPRAPAPPVLRSAKPEKPARPGKGNKKVA